MRLSDKTVGQPHIARVRNGLRKERGDIVFSPNNTNSGSLPESKAIF